MPQTPAFIRVLVAATLGLAPLAGCGPDDGGKTTEDVSFDDSLAEDIPDATPDADPGPPAPGSLVGLSFEATVGVHLGDLPDAAQTDAETWLVEQPETFWLARARRHIELTTYRLHHRHTYDRANSGRDILPLPPADAWKIDFEGPAELRVFDGHPAITRKYTFSAVLLGPPGAPAQSDPGLGPVGGVIVESFVLPVDPDHLLERTGRACINTLRTPATDIDPANARFFYDDGCRPGPASGGRGACHRSAPYPTEACVDAVGKSVGRVAVDLRFEHLPWDDALADAVRVGALTPGVADLRAAPFAPDDVQVVFRYFAHDACAVVRGCVGGAGWRRLLQFKASVDNVGAEPVVLGDTRSGGKAANAGLVSQDVCDRSLVLHRYRLLFFGARGARIGALRGGCVEGLRRAVNDEGAPFVHRNGCDAQGMAPGWGEAGHVGAECQWVDVTDVDTGRGGVEAPLGFQVNPDRMLCEGVSGEDGDGAVAFEATTLKDPAGRPEARVMCEEGEGLRANNEAQRAVVVPFGNGGAVTEPCGEGAFGALRDCGFKLPEAAVACVAGAGARLRCEGQGRAAVVRVCEASDKRGVMPCRAVDALATEVIGGGGEPVEVAFGCPAGRPWPDSERGGEVGVLAAPLVPGDAADVACSIVR